MIATYLDLSTGHLRRETMDYLSNYDQGTCCALGWPAMSIAPYMHGCFVTVPGEMTDEQMDALPSDLEEVLSYARSKQASVVRFDSDGDEIDDLHIYGWSIE